MVFVGEGKYTLPTKSTQVTVKIVREMVCNFIKQAAKTGTTTFEELQSIAGTCLALFPPELNDVQEVKTHLEKLTQEFPTLQGIFLKLA